MLIKRPQIRSEILSLLVAAYLVLAFNSTFWTKAAAYFGEGSTGFWAFAIAISAGFAIAMVVVSVKYLSKPVFILLILISAATAWFTDTFGAVIDQEMILNTMQTTPAEAGHLITPGFLLHYLLFAIVPCLLIAWVKIVHRPYISKLGWNAALTVVLAVIFVASATLQMPAIASTLRQHRDLLKYLTPVTPVVSVTQYFFRAASNINRELVVVDADASKGADLAAAKQPMVTIIVAGETARAQNFSLGGYGKQTNPLLENQDITYFPDTTSCGTATATSIPCMFSKYGRKDFNFERGQFTENLLDVFRHAGVQAEWWENNTGDKGVAARSPSTDFSALNDPAYCVRRECLDQILLDHLDDWLDNVTSDSVLVLHQIGSHGPTYYLRYPEEFRRFTPDCRTAEFAKCSQEEIVNAYDNTILYTDYILSSVIDKLKARAGRLSGSMLYMSDHGESLGEKGLYLHGTPYMFAPSEQTHVPFVIWMSDAFAETARIDRACISALSGEEVSHDNLYHTALGMMEIIAASRDPKLDLTDGCKQTVSQ